MNHFKIRNKTTGLFRKPGAYEFRAWSKSGKVWVGSGPLRNHLNLCIENNIDMSDWEIIEFEMTEKSTTLAHNYISHEKLVTLIKRQ